MRSLREYIARHALALTIVTICMIVTICAMPTAAYAQAVGGAGGSFLSGLLSWVSSNVVGTLGDLAIIAVGAMMFFQHFHLIAILAVCAGIWVMVNYQSVYSMITGGG